MYRERITITVEPELLEAIDGVVDRDTIRNRSHAIEHLLREGLGLHELQQAVVILEIGWTAEQLQQFATLCKKEAICSVYIGIPSSQLATIADISTVIHQLSPATTVEPIPTDFGSGGALVLLKEKLPHPFVLVTLAPETYIPGSLLQPYLFHKNHRALVTTILLQDGTQMSQSGIRIISPELISSIPAGIVSLETTVFPDAAKAGKIRAYVITK